MKRHEHFKILSTYRTKFSDVFSELGNENIVIGGRIALGMHGLKMTRKVDDLDLIVYSPTAQQLSYLDELFKKEKAKDNPIPYGEVQRSYKIKRDNIVLDILTEHTKGLPMFLLQYDGFKINSIDNIIEAKQSYRMKAGSDQLAYYCRIKDVEDFEDLRLNNFNLKDITIINSI